MRRRWWLTVGAFAILLFLAAHVANPGPSPAGDAAGAAATPRPLLMTAEQGSALRVGPHGAEHAVGFLANGAGAIGIVVAPDGAFLAFTCGMRPQPDAWYSGDWYRGTLIDEQPVEVAGPDGEMLRFARTPENRLVGTLTSAAEVMVPVAAVPASAETGLYRRDDADGVLGAVALPGITVCAVKRTTEGQFLPAGTIPF